jgi:nicotinate-nucleotide pyrophosphorylase (carboxylating)
MSVRDVQQIEWNEAVADECRRIVRVAKDEYLAGRCDWTTAALVPADAVGRAAVVMRQAGVVAGLPTAIAALG